MLKTSPVNNGFCNLKQSPKMSSNYSDRSKNSNRKNIVKFSDIEFSNYNELNINNETKITRDSSPFKQRVAAKRSGSNVSPKKMK